VARQHAKRAPVNAKRLSVALGVVILAVVARGPLEQTMQRHMLVQLPMLVAAGVLLAQAFTRRQRPAPTSTAWNVHGIAGLLLASGVVMTWMIPRALDAAVEHIIIDAAKFASLLAAGAIGATSWRAATTLVRTFVVGNTAWMMATVGMLLLDAPVRLCTSYGASDQRVTGIALVALTIAAIAGALVLITRQQPTNANDANGRDTSRHAGHRAVQMTAHCATGIARFGAGAKRPDAPHGAPAGHEDLSRLVGSPFGP